MASARLLTHVARLRNWLLLTANRYLLTASIVLAGFLLFIGLAFASVLDVGRSTTPMLYLFSALVGGNITLITIVVTITQLILARELRSPRELQMELESAEDYRESVEEETERPGVPEQPTDFLRVLVEDTLQQVMILDSTLGEFGDGPLRDEFVGLTENLSTELDRTLEQLETSRGGVFPALLTILDADFAARLNHSRWIRQTYDDGLSDSQQTLLGDLEQRIEQLDIARQYFKTIYIKQQLADASKLVMYTGLVAVLVALALLVVVGYAQTSLSPLTRFVLVPLAVAINLLPLSLLIAHVIRITTVVRRTAAITPFISPSE